MNCDDIRALLGEGELCEQTDRGFRIVTHCLHPSFEQVAVYALGWGDGFIVTDDGGAATAAMRHGRDELATQSGLKKASIRFGLTLENGVLIAKTPDASWLKSAVLSVANASAMASAEALNIVAAKQERLLHELIFDEIKKAVPEHRIANGYHYRGSSGKDWPIDFAVIGGDIPLLIKGVSAHHNSISASYTAFGDIGVNDNISRFAVHSQPLGAEDATLMRQVAQLVPLRSVEAGVRRLVN